MLYYSCWQLNIERNFGAIRNEIQIIIQMNNRVYGIRLWGYTKSSNMKIMQRLQSKIMFHN